MQKNNYSFLIKKTNVFLRKVIFALLLLHTSIGFSLYKQDSLLRVLDTAKTNKVIVKTLLNLWYYNYENNELDKAFDWIQKAHKHAISVNDTNLIYLTTANLGVHYDFLQNYGAALYHSKLSLKFIKKNKDYYKRLMFMRLTIANLFYKSNQIKRYKNELDSIEIFLDKISDTITLFNFYAEKARYYTKIQNIDSALKYSNITIYKFKNEFQYVLSEIDIRQKSLYDYALLHKDWAIKNKLLIEKYYNEYKSVYYKNYSNVQMHGHNSFLLYTASLFLNENKIDSAKCYYNKIIEVNKGKITPDFKMPILELALQIAVSDKNFQKVAEITNNIKQIKDSILLAVQANNLKSTESFFDSEEQANIEKLNAQKSELIAEEGKKRNKTIITYSIIIVLILIIGIILLRKRFKLEQKQKSIIELKNKETEEQKQIIEQKAAELSIKHKEIKDSINYAERIQRSFLASKDLLDENLKNYFVLFQPKDIVSGDFYWAKKLHAGQFILVTADSTGHGVPGAIMSLLNITSLESAIKDGHTSPADILNETRKTIIERLKKDGSKDGGKDGMDASLISFDLENKQLTYSAANNPIFIIRNKELIELKPDKMPIGKHDKDTEPFTQTKFDLQTGDHIYTLTDGLPDQFGGTKGKKFMYKQLRELLISISNEPIENQKLIISNTFDKWKGNLEQVDDVCLIGVKI